MKSTFPPSFYRDEPRDMKVDKEIYLAMTWGKCTILNISRAKVLLTRLCPKCALNFLKNKIKMLLSG